VEWFGVKLLYKISITGKADKEKIDEYYYEENVFFEENVLLVKAESSNEAYKIAENKAMEEYELYQNKYGQVVEYCLYDSIDCFNLFESPDSLVEVYSTFFVKNKNEDDKCMLSTRYSNCTASEMHLLRHA
jgi:hypothetical protein